MSSTGRTRNRRGQGEQLRQQILDAATTLLSQSGDADAVGMRAVAAACGITPPSVYAHFANKADLLRAATAELFDQFDRALAAAESGATDPFDALARRAHAYVQFGDDNPGIYRALFANTVLGRPAVGDDRAHPGSASFRELVAAVVRCVAAGAVVDRPGETLAVELWAGLHGIVDLRATKPEVPWPPAGLLTDDALTHLGLRPPRTKQPR
jgi:AcrR family transcriptional regulator